MALANVKVNSDRNGLLEFLVDSGSDVSLIKHNIITNVVGKNLILNGLNGQLRTWGFANLVFFVGNISISHDFAVVDDGIPLPVDGLIGRDFLRRFGVTLDYGNGILRINGNTLPLTPERHVFLGTARMEITKTHVDRVLDALKVSMDEVPPEARRGLRALVVEYADIFRFDDDFIPANNFYKQGITLTDDEPVYVPQYRLPHSQRGELRRQVENLLAQGIIRPSRSHYNNPNLLVPKKNGGWRMVTDFRRLNNKLVKDKYPIPRFDDIFDNMGGSTETGQTYFSTFDLTKGFYQIALEEDSCKYTAFSTDFGFFEYVRMPFGIAMAPNSFSRMMAWAFAPLLGHTANVFMDDLVAKGPTVEGHLDSIRQIFAVCRDRDLSLNPSKAVFFKPSVTYLGHELTQCGIYPDSTKYMVLEQYPVPTNRDDVKRFVSFASYYRRFIKNFAEIAFPLNKLTRKGEPFVWDEHCQGAFDNLREKLMKPPLLIYPDFGKPFVIYTDASNFSLGAVLCQEIQGMDRPIHYWSANMTKGDLNKSTIEKELEAMYRALIYFRPYIYGTKFTIKSDHRPLVYLFSLRNPTSKLNRIRMEFEEHNFEVIYVPGKENVMADALSRITIAELRSQTRTVMAVTTRLQAHKQKLVSEDTNNVSEVPQRLVTVDEVVPPKFPEVDNFVGRRYPEIVSHLGAGEIIVGYGLRRRNRKGLFHVKLKHTTTKNKKAYSAGALLEALIEIHGKALTLNLKSLKIRSDDELLLRCSPEVIAKFLKANNTVQIFVYRAPMVVDNKEERIRIIGEYHLNPLLGAHSGYGKLLSKLKSKYLWRHMSKDVYNYVKNCEKCQMNKPSRKTIEELCLTETPEKAFDIISIDTVGPLPCSAEGYNYLLTIQCNLTKFVVAEPMRTKSANNVARALFESFIFIHGFFKCVKSDKGTEYCNAVFADLLKICKLEHRTSAGYRPQTIGGLERNHRTLNEYFRSYLNNQYNDWPQLIKYYVFAYNTTPNFTINDYTPYELVYGRAPNLPDF